MSEVFKSPRHEALRRLIREKRLLAELTQRDLAALLGRSQSFISDVEKGQYRVTVVEFLEIAEAIGFNPAVALRRVAKAAKR